MQFRTFWQRSNFRPSIPSAASQTVTVCILCSQHSENTNEYEEDCTLFNMGLPGWPWQRLRIAPFYFVFEALTRKHNLFYTLSRQVLYHAKLQIVARIA